MGQMKKIYLPVGLLAVKEFLFGLTFFYLPIYLLSIGMTGFEMGVLVSIFTITALFGSFITGYLCDRINIRYLMIFSLFIISIYYFSLTVFSSFVLLLILFFLGGLGNNVINLVISSFVLKSADNKKKGNYIGFFHSLKVVGSAAGILAGGFLIDTVSFSSTFKISGLLFLVLLVLSFFVGKISFSYQPLLKYSKDFFKTKVLFLCLIVFLFTLHWGAEGTVYSLFLVNNLGLTTTSAGIFMAIPIFFLALFSYLAGKKIDTGIKPSTILFIGLLLSGFGHIVLVYPVVLVSFFARIVHEIGDALLLIFIYVSIYKLFPKSRVGGLTGAVTTVMIFGSFLGSLVFAPLGTIVGYGWPLAISGIILLFTLVIVLFKKEMITS